MSTFQLSGRTHGPVCKPGTADTPNQKGDIGLEARARQGAEVAAEMGVALLAEGDQLGVNDDGIAAARTAIGIAH